MIRLIASDFSESRFVTEAISFSASDKFNDYGTFTLELVPTYNNPLVKIGNYLISESFQGYIEDVEFSSESVVIHGYSLNKILDRRVLLTKEQYTEEDNAEASIYRLVKYYTGTLEDQDEDTATRYRFRTFDFVVDEPEETTILDTVSQSFEAGAKLGECVCKCCEELEVGNRVYIEMEDIKNKKPTLHFKLFAGNNLAIRGNKDSVLFSTDMMNLSSIGGKIDYSDFVNRVYVFGEDLNGNTIAFPVQTEDLQDGDELRIGYAKVTKQQSKTTDADGNEITDSNGDSVAESNTTYNQRMWQAGYDKLREQCVMNTFTAEADATDYGKRFFLGDMVYCNSSKFGVGFSAQVSAYTQTMDSTGTKKTVTLGSTIRRYR